MTDDDGPDDTPRDYDNGDGRQQHTGPYRGLDPMQAELLRRLDRLDRVEHDVDRIDRIQVAQTASRRFWGWAAGLGVPSLIIAAFTLLLWSADRVSTSAANVGRTEAKIEGQGELIKLLQQEIIELRRRAGLDGHPNSDVPQQPDRMSSLDQSRDDSDGSSTSGLVLRHSPKLQNLQSCPAPPHWMLLLHVEKHVDRGLIVRSRSSSGVGIGRAVPERRGVCMAGEVLQPAMTSETMTTSILSIPEM